MSSIRLAYAMTTTAAEGLPRRCFTVAELEKMTAAGILLEDERLELIGGDIVPMSPKGKQHEALKAALLAHWYSNRPPEIMLIPETTLRLSKDTYLEPDVVVYRRSDGLDNLNAETALLVVEIADTSLKYDLDVKTRIYSGFGVDELWVIDAVKLTTRIHRGPTPTGYRSVSDWPASQELVPSRVSDLKLTLSSLDLR
ncbi:MAG: Uma2 family endonuclease [Rhodomicrobium sp.]|nr:Uma2 family endonuclease [Rhodomicrobium sp.]